VSSTFVRIDLDSGQSVCLAPPLSPRVSIALPTRDSFSEYAGDGSHYLFGLGVWLGPVRRRGPFLGAGERS